jgi:hypothetical protein
MSILKKIKMLIYIQPASRIDLDKLYVYYLERQRKKSYGEIVEDALKHYIEHCDLPKKD